ncbi:MAG: (2Fe-2S) ferredoxin domain-containing protein [Steroidobacteraceae bacterium]
MLDGSEIILIARSAIGSAAIEEMRAAADHLVAAGATSHASYAFTEQGEPSLRERLRERIDAGAKSIVLLPLLVPLEPSFPIWIGKVLARWEHADTRSWPPVWLAPGPLAMPQACDVLLAAANAAATHPQPARPPPKPQGSAVPTQKYQVLVCHGAPCVAEGAPVIWGHLRNEQARRSLRVTGEGMMSARTTCLGPCNLAPVVQVWPQGTMYGGVDERGVDLIIDRHILHGEVAEDYAYPADGSKHVLREHKEPSE